MPLAPVEELIPAFNHPIERDRLLRSVINRLIPLVSRYLAYAEIPTELVITEPELNEEGTGLPKLVPRERDMIDHLFELLQRRDQFATYTFVMQAAERGIGVYEDLKETQRRLRHSPLTWIGWMLRLPITVLERAGVETDEASSKVVAGYGWFLRIAMGAVLSSLAALLSLLATKLGTSIPWKEIESVVRHSK